jgi:hypothetical protein
MLTLREFHPEADVLVAQFFDDGREVRVIHNVPGHHSNHCVYKSHQTARRFEGTNCWGVTSLGDHVEPDRHESKVIVFPDRSLEFDALLKVFD